MATKVNSKLSRCLPCLLCSDWQLHDDGANNIYPRKLVNLSCERSVVRHSHGGIRCFTWCLLFSDLELHDCGAQGIKCILHFLYFRQRKLSSKPQPQNGFKGKPLAFGDWYIDERCTIGTGWLLKMHAIPALCKVWVLSNCTWCVRQIQRWQLTNDYLWSVH